MEPLTVLSVAAPAAAVVAAVVSVASLNCCLFFLLLAKASGKHQCFDTFFVVFATFAISSAPDFVAIAAVVEVGVTFGYWKESILRQKIVAVARIAAAAAAAVASYFLLEVVVECTHSIFVSDCWSAKP